MQENQMSHSEERDNGILSTEYIPLEAQDNSEPESSGGENPSQEEELGTFEDEQKDIEQEQNSEGLGETRLGREEDILDKMVQETYLLLQEIEAQNTANDGYNPKVESSPTERDFSPLGGIDRPRVEDQSGPGPGVVYAIQFSATTFILRLLPVREVQDFFRPDSPIRLRFIGELKRDSLPTQLQFFPTDNYEMAELISENFALKRFPINDDLALDVDQFQGQWWLLTSNPERFEIRFSYPGEIARARYQKLGPLGDAQSVAMIFDRARPVLTSTLALNLYEINERRIVLESVAGGLGPKNLSSVFQGAKSVSWLYEKTQGALGARFFRFLKEIRTQADFWQEVETNASQFLDKKN